MPVPSDPHQLLAGLRDARAALQLDTTDLCFLVALELRAERAGLASFHDDALVDTYLDVCALCEPGADNPAKRATHAIQRLRDQRLLARLDGGRLTSAGEYTLTGLARHIAAFFARDEALTRESLTLLTGTLIGNLHQIKTAAESARTAETWHAEVIAPLRITVGELIGGIQRRQRGLDRHQEEVQQRIAVLLRDEWVEAIEQCQTLLDATGATLAELGRVLVHDAQNILALLQDVRTAADEAGADEAEQTAQRVIEHVDRVVDWGEARQRAWSEYYQYVHGYLRDVVRLDPDRALSERLRAQIAGWREAPFALRIAADPGLPRLREPQVVVRRPPLARPRAEREVAPTPVAAQDERAALEAQIREAWRAGARTLAEITGLLIAGLPPERRFVTVGRVAALVARLARPRPLREAGWVAVDDRIIIEDWPLDGTDAMPDEPTGGGA